jgi:hypothetical protein
VAPDGSWLASVKRRRDGANLGSECWRTTYLAARRRSLIPPHLGINDNRSRRIARPLPPDILPRASLPIDAITHHHTPEVAPTLDKLRQTTATISINIHSNMGTDRVQPPVHHRTEPNVTGLDEDRPLTIYALARGRLAGVAGKILTWKVSADGFADRLHPRCRLVRISACRRQSTRLTTTSRSAIQILMPRMPPVPVQPGKS